MHTGDFARQPFEVETEMDVSVIKAFGERTRVEMPTAEGAHGGGDDVLRDLIFKPRHVPAHLALPGSRAGAMSCLTGIAAVRSSEENRPVNIADLLGRFA